MLEDIKPQLGELKTKLDQMGESLEVPAKEEKIAELEYKMGEPTFWDDAEKAQKINQEIEALIREKPEQYLWGYNRYKHPDGAEPRPEKNREDAH